MILVSKESPNVPLQCAIFTSSMHIGAEKATIIRRGRIALKDQSMALCSSNTTCKRYGFLLGSKVCVHFVNVINNNSGIWTVSIADDTAKLPVMKLFIPISLPWPTLTLGIATKNRRTNDRSMERRRKKNNHSKQHINI